VVHSPGQPSSASWRSRRHSANGKVRNHDQVTETGMGQDGAVSAADDTFAAFVDVLADALDEDEASGDDLAVQVHLSRA
jgi:hypothetical protein